MSVGQLFVAGGQPVECDAPRAERVNGEAYKLVDSPLEGATAYSGVSS